MPNIAGRQHRKDQTITTLLTASSWLLGQLPYRVREDQRAALVETLRQADDLVVEVHAGAATIQVRDGSNLLLRVSARAP